MDEELKVHLITYNVGTWAPHHDFDMTTLLPQKTVPGKVHFFCQFLPLGAFLIYVFVFARLLYTAVVASESTFKLKKFDFNLQLFW